MAFRRRLSILAAVAALTLGIGVNTAIFSVVNAVLLKPVSFPDPDRLVVLMTTSPDGNGSGGSPAKFQHFREQSSVVQDVSAYRTGVVNYTGGSMPEQLRSAQVSSDFFRLFGAPILRGRPFTAEEDRPDGPPVVVLSSRLWSTRFNSDPDIVGKPISLSGESYTIVGVLPETAVYPNRQARALVPFSVQPADANHLSLFSAIGLLLKRKYSGEYGTANPPKACSSRLVVFSPAPLMPTPTAATW